MFQICLKIGVGSRLSRSCCLARVRSRVHDYFVLCIVSVIRLMDFAYSLKV